MAWISVSVRTLSRCAALGLVLAIGCAAQKSSPWRFWDTADGFTESYTSSMALSPGGGLWVKHGNARAIELLDGYSVKRYSDPGGLGIIESAPDGTLWMWSGSVLRRLADPDDAASRWSFFKVDAVTNFGAIRINSDEGWEITSARLPYFHAIISIVPLDREHVLIMLPDRILEFDADRSSSRTVLNLARTGLSRFLSMRAARDGTVWLAGSGGVGWLSPKQDWQWTPLPRPPLPWVDFAEPFEGLGSATKLFVTGTTASQASAALGFDGRRWHEIYRSDSSVTRVWPGSGGSAWVQDGNRVVQVSGEGTNLVEKTGTLSGILIGMRAQSPDRFWVSSSQGLAMRTRSLWETPPGARDLDEVVNAITEDRAGNLWFLSAHALIRYDNSKWSTFPLPKEETAWSVFTEGPGLLPDGRLVIVTTGGHWLIFDPVRHTFSKADHPRQRTPRLFVQGPDGRLIVETYPAGSSSGMTLESFDGHTFRPFLGAGVFRDDLRNLLVRSNGEVWAGGNGYFAVRRGPKTVTIGPADGYTDQGAYYIYEDPAGPLVAGGPDGFHRLEGGKWRLIRSGLDRVRNIITARDGTLWIASGTGIHRYRNGEWITNGQEEGLPSSVAYKVFEDSRGRIWAGTTRGLSLFNPSADAEPPVALMADDQNPREAPPGGKIRLEFSGIDRWKKTLPERLLFSYRMDDGAWTPFAASAFASYDKLPAGPHRFEVRAMDRNGNVGLRSAGHDFSVLLPWYATRGFLGIATSATAIIIVLTIMAVVSYRRRGDLIRKLNLTNKLERDRQSILELIAKREPLPLILERIAACVAENSPGSNCAIILNHETSLSNERCRTFSQPALPEALVRSLEAHTAAAVTDNWWYEIDSVSRDCFPGPCQAVPLRSGDGIVLGAMLLLSGHTRFVSSETRASSEAGRRLLETFGGLATAAIENARLYERLAQQASHDALTGLPNRLSFDDRLQSAVAHAAANGHTLAVLYLDLDRFKQINDSLGHRVGDLLLKHVAARLCRALNGEAILARIGGDEFTVLLEKGAGKSVVARMATAMLESLEAPIQIEGHDLFAGASIGASFFPSDAVTPVDLQKYADIAMYRAKARGKNCLEFFSPEMGSLTDAAIGIEQILRRALEESRFELHYQPQFTPAGALVGFEALLRLDDPDRGPIGPADFIPIAEETGLIVPVGTWVLREACGQLRRWLGEGLPAVRMSVNVSALEIIGDSFADKVSMILAEEGIEPRLLELELTESAIVRNQAESLKQMEKLRLHGVRLAIDDFGTGYSSFANLQNLPLDTLKIDRSFLAGTGQLIRTIVDLGHNLGLTVVAEGVETDTQVAIVRESRCDLVQGYRFGRPQPALQARAILAGAAESSEMPVGVV